MEERPKERARPGSDPKLRAATSDAARQTTDSYQCCHCSACGEKVVFLEQGKRLSTAPGVVFLEEALLRDDPFASQGGRLPLQVGAVCSLCSGRVCMRRSCSLFYSRRFCGGCARSNRQHFPGEIVKLEKEVFGISDS